MDKVKEYLEPLKDFADKNMEYTYAFALIGAGLIGVKLARSVREIYKYTIRPSYNLGSRYGNNWAVVTGATDGIGKAIAEELARRGFKIVLVGRNQEKLTAVADKITADYKVLTKTVKFDFNTHYTKEKIDEVNALFADIDKVSILINNVGAVSVGQLIKMSDEDIHKQLNVNIIGTTVFTKAMIPKLLANQSKSAILFIGSGAATAGPLPNIAVYSATKSYVHQFGESLAGEHKDKIDVTVSGTKNVKSNMNSGRYLFTVSAEAHATHVLAKLGHDRITHGHRTHAFSHWLTNQYISGSIINYINNKRIAAFLKEKENKA